MQIQVGQSSRRLWSTTFIMFALRATLIVILLWCPLALCAEYIYNTTNQSFPNPDRGWYSYAPILGNDSYAAIGNNGGRLVYGAITLRDFIHSDISSSVLNTISQRFAEMRSSGIKAVLRVNYNEEDTGTDANMAQMIRHMKQLQPILTQNSDVIAYIEIGYFGQWGEWHDWCNGQQNTNLTDDFCSKHLDNEDTWRWLISEQLQFVPANRFLLVRYPGKKQAIAGGVPVTSVEAYTSIEKARIGHHNDCFLASPDDMGTYQIFGTSPTVQALKEYLAEETQYLPMGGETCSASSGHRFDCATAVPEMAKLHWTYLNQDYYKGALDQWKSEECFEEIDRRLGYRFELLSADLPDNLLKGATQTLVLRVRNSGFARAHYSRKAYLRLFRGAEMLSALELSGVDFQEIGGGETKVLSGTFVVPETLSEQPVSVAIWLPDDDQRNWNNSRFSLRLAYVQDEASWNQMSSAGHNVLADNVPVLSTSSQPTVKSPTGLRVSSLQSALAH